jgi:hypothetical protein
MRTWTLARPAWSSALGVLKVYNLLATVAITLALAAPAHAWGSRCNPTDAKAKYICALANCELLSVTYSDLMSMPPEAIKQKITDKSALADYSLWKNSSSKVDITKIRELDVMVWSAVALAGRQMVTDFKAAPISDYQCKANITFAEAKLDVWIKAIL